MRRLPAFAAFVFFAVSAYCQVAEFGLRSASLRQRGVCKTQSAEFAVDLMLSVSDTLKIVLRNDFATLAKLEFSKSGELLKASAGAWGSGGNVRDFASDMKLVLGFYPALPAVVHTVSDAAGNPLKIVDFDGGREIDFSYAPNARAGAVPDSLEIKSGGCILKLKTVQILRK